MGKHEKLNSPEKLGRPNERSNSSATTQTRSQHNSLTNSDVLNINDLAIHNIRKNENTSERNGVEYIEHEIDKQVTTHPNGKKKKRRNKAKAKNNPKQKAVNEVNALEDIIDTKDRVEEGAKSVCTSDVETHVSGIGAPSLDRNERRDKSQKIEDIPPTLDVNTKLRQSVGREHLQGANLSPRKQTILRYKKSDDRLTESSLISEAKDNLKNKKNSKTPDINCDRIDESVLLPLTDLDMDKKVSLFKYKYSRILVFDEQLDNTRADLEKPSSGRLLGHGEFEIFQLHNGDVTYLSCGPSFIYPLLPKLKILRISFNQFILPLVNPERYWRIYINSEDRNVIEILETTFDRLVKYRNLYFGLNHLQPMDEKQTTEIESDGYDASSVKNIASTKLQNLDEDSKPLQLNSDSQHIEILHPDRQSHHQFPVIFNEIPDSPPSAPLSPHNDGVSNINLLTPTKSTHLLPGWSIKHKPSEKSLTSAIASLNVSSGKDLGPNNGNESRNKFLPGHSSDLPISSSANNQKLHQPKPKRYNNLSNQHSSKHKDKPTHDNKSDSSMDSLLDEYEENIITTKSINFNSRPPSRPMSVASSYSRPQINYTRGSYFHGPIGKDPDETANSQYNENFDDLVFPTTSLSEYNKARNGGNSGFVKSRRSSRSELYNSESNWMEPSTTAIESGHNRIPKSRTSIHDSNRRINNDVKQIYRSFTQRNLSQYTNDGNNNIDSKANMLHLQKVHPQKVQPAFNPVKIRSPAMALNRKGSYANSVLSGRTGYESLSRYSGINEVSIPHSKSVRNDLDQQRLGNYKVKLNSSEVYKMVSESRSNKNLNAIINGPRDIKPSDAERKPQASGGFASRLFGW